MFHKVARAGGFFSLRDICQVPLTPGQFLLLARISRRKKGDEFSSEDVSLKIVALTSQITHTTFTKGEENFPSANLQPRFGPDTDKRSPRTPAWQT